MYITMSHEMHTNTRVTQKKKEIIPLMSIVVSDYGGITQKVM